MYNNVIKGTLKLKGGEGLKSTGKKEKKKKKKDKESTEIEVIKEEKIHRFDLDKDYVCPKTDAEKSFDIAQKKRVEARTLKAVEMTHRERMEKFNLQLGGLSEHFDIPKVGPG